ncbi:MAG TPA: hypothetical protein DF383_09435 [Deltaproteobacteria bacterium]|nr:hypothetical protein [Deltaproteobacteria bacterium]
MTSAEKTDFDVILLGAGLAGVATLEHLSRIPGVSLLLLEKEAHCAAHASGKNAALLRQALPDAAAAGLVQETLRLLRQPPRAWKHSDIYHPYGSLLYGQRETIAALRKTLLACGAEFMAGEAEIPLHLLPERWRESLLDRAPEAWLYCPQDGVVAVRKLLENWLEASQARGARFQSGAEVLTLRREGERWRVECGSGAYTARAVVNAAGAWADEVACRAGLAPRGLQPLRRHLYVSEVLPDLDPELPFVWDIEQELYFRPEDGGLLLCAGDEEPHPAGAPEIDAKIEKILRHKLRQYFPVLADLELRRAWACLRTKWPPRPYLLEAEPEAPGFFWVAGLGGHGLGISFGLGALAALKIQDFLKKS